MTTFYSFQKKIDKSIEDSSIDKELRDDFLLISLYFAQLAYFSPSYVQAQLDKMNAVSVSIYNEIGVQAVFAEFETFAVVAFKGHEVDKWQEMKIDLQAWKTTFHGFRVHHGFADTLRKVSDRLCADLNNVSPRKRILYAGHSLGGALATLMTLIKRPTDACTFGAPRSVDASDVARYLKDVNITRVYAKNDFVCNIPPEFMGYGHVGDALRIEGLNSRWDSHKLITYLSGVVGNCIIVDGDNCTVLERLHDFLIPRDEDDVNENQV